MKYHVFLLRELIHLEEIQLVWLMRMASVRLNPFRAANQLAILT